MPRTSRRGDAWHLLAAAGWGKWRCFNLQPLQILNGTEDAHGSSDSHYLSACCIIAAMRALVVDPGGFSLPYDLRLVEGLRGVGVDVKFLTPTQQLRVWQDPDALPAESESPGARFANAISKRAEYLRLLQAVYTSTKNWKPDIVHFQWLPFPFLEYHLLKWVSRRSKTIFTMHNVGSSHEPRGGLRSFKRLASYRLFDRIIVHSDYSKKEALLQRIAAERKISVIQHGALSHYQKLADGVERASTERVKILLIGSIKPYKGLHSLIKAVTTGSQLMGSSKWELCIAGKPSYDISSLRKEVEVMGMTDRVKWITRHLTEREYAELLQQSDVVVLPYTGIDQSGVLMAAIGMGKPVVATKVGAFPELLTSGKHGLLVEPSDPTALSMALHQLIESPKQRAEIAKNLRQLASTTLSWSRLAQQTRELYQEALSG